MKYNIWLKYAMGITIIFLLHVSTHAIQKGICSMPEEMNTASSLSMNKWSYSWKVYDWQNPWSASLKQGLSRHYNTLLNQSNPSKKQKNNSAFHCSDLFFTKRWAKSCWVMGYDWRVVTGNMPLVSVVVGHKTHAPWSVCVSLCECVSVCACQFEMCVGFKCVLVCVCLCTSLCLCVFHTHSITYSTSMWVVLY